MFFKYKSSRYNTDINYLFMCFIFEVQSTIKKNSITE